AFDTDLQEAAGIARLLRDGHRPGRPWSHMAVLARTNAQLPMIEAALGVAGIPHRSTGASFVDHAEVRSALEGWRRSPVAVPFLARLQDLAALALQTAADEERTAVPPHLLPLAPESPPPPPGA